MLRMWKWSFCFSLGTLSFFFKEKTNVKDDLKKLNFCIIFLDFLTHEKLSFYRHKFCGETFSMFWYSILKKWKSKKRKYRAADFSLKILIVTVNLVIWYFRSEVEKHQVSLNVCCFKKKRRNCHLLSIVVDFCQFIIWSGVHKVGKPRFSCLIPLSSIAMLNVLQI